MTPIVTTSHKKKSGGQRTTILLAAMAILLIGVAVLYCRKSGKPTKPQATQIEQDTTVAVEAATNITADAKAPQQTTASAVESGTGIPAGSDIYTDARGILRAADTNSFVRRPGYLMLPSGRVLTFKPPAEGDTVKVHSFGRVYECDSEGNFTDITKPPIFDNLFENQMVGLATPGSVFFNSGILNHTPEELDEMLHKEVVINPDDDEDVVYKKQAVAAMKKQILDYLADGGDFAEFVQRMQSYSKEERRLRTKGMNKLEDLLEAGDLDAARRFVKAYNEILDENYFAPLKITKKWREQLYPDGEPAEDADDAVAEGISEDTTDNE